MRRKWSLVLIAALAGMGLGAVLGYGPLLRFKSEGVLSVEMGTAEYKRFSELASDATTAQRYFSVSPPPSLGADAAEALTAGITRGEWLKPVPKVSKADAKEVPDLLLQLEQDREKAARERDGAQIVSRERDAEQSGSRRPPPYVYLGVRLTHTASDAREAADVATWLGAYFKDVATREAVREQVFRWAADSRQFSDRALERKLKYQFDIEQAQTRSAALKKILATYPEAARREGQQVVDVRKDNEKFMSPLAQLVGAESEIIDIREKLQKLDREIEQHGFAKALVEVAEASLTQARSGSESVQKLSEVIIDFSKKVKTEAEREKLSSLAADLSQISARFLSQAQFVAQPSVPARPERPGPRLVMALAGLLAGLACAVWLWRESLMRLLRDDAVE